MSASLRAPSSPSSG